MNVDSDQTGYQSKPSGFKLALERITSWSIPFFALVAVASIAMQNIIYLGLAAWIIWIILDKRSFFVKTPMNWPMVLLAIVLIGASLWEGRLNSSFFGIRKIGLMLIFFITANVVRHPLKADRNLNFLLIGAGVCALWSIISHLFGWDSGRARSFSGDYMAAGGMYMVSFVIATSRFLHARKELQWKWFSLALVLATALLLTYTRSSWIAAAIGILILGFLRDWRLPAILLTVAVLFIVLFPKNPVSERVFSLNSKYHSSNVERRYMWVSALKLIKDRPIKGYGIDNLSIHYGKVANPKAIEQRPPHVHNTIMQMAINGGITAAGLYIWWIIILAVYGFLIWRRLKKEEPERAGAALGITVALVGFFINGLFEFNFGTSQLITIIYFISGLLPAYYATNPNEPVWTLPKKPRVLFLRPRFRGDVLMASTVARLMKRDYPDSQVDLLTEPASVGATHGEPSWNHVLSVPRKGFLAWCRNIKAIRHANYDVVCDLFGNPRTAIIALFSGARFRIGPRITAYDLFFHYKTEPYERGPRPAWESYYDVLRAFGMKQLSLRPRWVITEEDDLWIKSFLKERKVSPGKVIGIFAGGSHQAKRWPLKNFLDIAKRVPEELGMKAVFVFGPLEKELKLDYMHATAKLSLSVEGLPPSRLAALWKHCAVVISNDAFPMHLGPAVNTPTIGLFGPSDPSIWFSYAEKSGHQAIHEAPVCWPCHKDVCDKLICWYEITPDMIIDKVKQIVKKKTEKKKIVKKKNKKEEA